MLFSPVRKVLTFQYRSVCCAAIKSDSLLHPTNSNLTVPKRHAFMNVIGVETKTKLYDFVNRLQIINPLNKSRFQANSWLLYEKSIDQIPYNDIIKKLNLPDTFNSWFLITELHLWMICVRVMNEGTKGSMIRNFIVDALWNDVEFRSKKLGSISPEVRNKQVKELSEQFQGALLGYDEGWLTNDKVLAGMVWRRVFNKNCDDPEKIELVVKYIRKQMSILQLQTFEDVFKHKNINWIKL